MHEITVYDIGGNSLTNLVQWDKDVNIFVQDEDIDKAYKVHFFNQNCGEAMVVESSYKDSSLSVVIPNDLLTEPLPIVGYIFIEKNNEHKSVYGFRIAVVKRPKPANYVYSDEKNYITFEQILDEIKSYATDAYESATLSKEYAEHSKDSENAAKKSEENSAASEESAANSAENAAQSANTASIKAEECATNAANAESFAHGGTGTRENEDIDNAMAYAQKAKDYSDEWKGSLLPQGTISFSELPTSENVAGHMYHINEAFVTDSSFKEGAGYSYPAGTNVYWTSDGKWDCLSGTLTMELTQAEYDSLTQEEKMNGTIYYISDADNALSTATDTSPGIVVVDSSLSETSENPVQNKIITQKINDEITRAAGQEALKAPIESPTFTGTPKAPTASENTNSTQLATTAFVKTSVANHNSSTASHDDIRNLISDLTTRLNALADSDDTTLDQLSEIVAYIKNNKSLIDCITTDKVSVSDIVDNLTSTATNKPLSAKQGKIMNDLITTLISTVSEKVDNVPGKGLSTNDYTTDEKNKLDALKSKVDETVPVRKLTQEQYDALSDTEKMNGTIYFITD